jgi:BMFP domain-containing protein YqiC
MGRPRKEDTMVRQEKVSEMFLQGYKDSEIIEKMKAIVPYTNEMLKLDKEAITANYIKAVTENKYLLAKQAESIMKHLDQLDLIKKKLWDIEQTAGQDTRGKLEALKTLLTELEHESKILKLIDTSHKIIKNYIHIDRINVLMEKLNDVVREFVPPEKQVYAYQRIKDMGNVLDTECSSIVDEVEKHEKKTEEAGS